LALQKANRLGHEALAGAVNKHLTVSNLRTSFIF